MSAPIHASCVVVGGVGILIRGPAGAGKTTLALALIDDAVGRGVAAALVADDRAVLRAEAGRLVASAPAAIAGLVELRGRGVVAEPFVAEADVALVVDLVAPAALPRLPEEAELVTEIAGVRLARQPAPAGEIVRSIILIRRALRPHHA